MLQAGGEVATLKGLNRESACTSGKIALKESAVTIIDLEGVIVESGGGLRESFGLGADGLAGKDWFEVFLGEEERAGVKADIEGLQENSAFSLTADYAATERVFQWSGFVFQAEGGARRVALTAEDVSGCRESGRQLESYMVELERMTRAQSSRELRMGEMRRKIGELEKSLVHCTGKGKR